MQSFVNSAFAIGSLTLPHRLIQGPLAGVSCAPFRASFSQFQPPAYCVSEMISAQDVLNKHEITSRYLFRSLEENLLCYQISGKEPLQMAKAAAKLQALGADLIDINCGCPKAKIRKKGAGSALLENIPLLLEIVRAVRQAITVPLTVKIRIQDETQNILISKHLEDIGIDALIVHGRHWTQDYDVPCDWQAIHAIKSQLRIPVIANGDISDMASLQEAYLKTGCDAFMISRAGTGRPWLYQQLLDKMPSDSNSIQQQNLFLNHVQGLATLENEHQALLQSKSFLHYYLKCLTQAELQRYYGLTQFAQIKPFLEQLSLGNTSTAIHV